MNSFKDVDDRIGSAQMLLAIPSMVIGVAILYLPVKLAMVTEGSDGWIVILAGGIISALIAWCIGKVASSYPGKSFTEYASLIVTRPVALVLTFIFSLISLSQLSHQLRSVANITGKYLLEDTPKEVIALTFLLVVIYAVSGKRVGIIRLNMLFFPIIIFITLVVLVFSLGRIKAGNLQPMFQTDFKGYFEAMKIGTASYLGFGILWFYTQYMVTPKKTPKLAVMGMGISLIVYIMIFLATVAVFGNAVTSNLIYPTIELAKAVTIPGEFFERFEAVFFVIWIMAIFNTSAMLLDIMVLTLSYVFTKVSKLTILFITSPLVFFIAMIPRNLMALDRLGSVSGMIAMSYTVIVVVILFPLSKIRRVK